MNTHATLRLQNFLTYELWNEGLKLLEFQISQKKQNKHYNTLSMFYYELVLEHAKHLHTREYYDSKIGNSFFYGLEKEFGALTYLTPKPGLGLRDYKFFSYPLRALYYSIGLYLLRITQAYLDEFRPQFPQIKSYYGGNLRFDKESLVLNYNTTFYKKHYQQFRGHIRKEASQNRYDKVVLKLDIKDYFDAISIPNLLNLIDDEVKPSIKAESSFDPTTIEQISFFYQFITSAKGGIPQSENDIVGSFIGYLYLVFADFVINKEIFRETLYIKDHKIIRYVDDIYIVLEFKKDVVQSEKESFIDYLSSRIADILYYRLKLKLNAKCRIFWLNNDDDLEALLRSLKKVSSGYYIQDDDREETPQKRVMSILKELRKIKKSRMGTYFILESSYEDDILKEIYDSSVDNLFNKKENQVLLEKVFSKFNFDFVKISSNEITLIMLHSEKIKNNYRNFLLRKKYLPTDDADLILKFLSQVDFSDQELLEKLKQNTYMKEVVELISSHQSPFHIPGYHELEQNRLHPLIEQSHIIDQIRLRVMSQNLKLYSVALNHLLNEVHAICLLKDTNTKKSSKEYDANDVRNFLLNSNVDYEVCVTIRNLFDRRNTNQVSHPGSPKNISWGVSQDEYKRYCSLVAKCLQVII